MIAITNEKIADLKPTWASFRGFTLLFDPPGQGLSRSAGLAYVDGDVEADPALVLYRALRDGLARLEPDVLAQRYLFCPLPSASYHVTVWDGVNDANLQQVRDEHRVSGHQFLRDLPDSLAAATWFSELSAADHLLDLDLPLHFRFERLAQWGHVSLVAQLAPRDDTSADALLRLNAARACLSDVFSRRFGVAPHPVYVPHVTLGYFANRDRAEQASPLVEGWNAVLREQTTGLHLEARRVGLYGFTDMATFFTAARADCAKK